MKHSIVAPARLAIALAIASATAASGAQLIDSRIQLSSGTVLHIMMISTLDPVKQEDPIYLQYDATQGQTTGNSRLVNVTVQGPTGQAAAAALMAATAVLTGTASPKYVNTILHQQAPATFNQVPGPGVPPLAPFDRAAIAQNAIGLANIVGGSSAISLVASLVPAFGLTGPCATTAAACGAVISRFDVDSRGRLLVIVSQNSGAPVSGAVVTLCMSMSGLPAVQMTATADSTGTATFTTILAPGDMIQGTRIALPGSPGTVISSSCLASGADCSPVAGPPGH